MSDQHSYSTVSRRRALQLVGASSLVSAAAACSRAGGGSKKSSGGGGNSAGVFAAGEPYDAPPKGNLNLFEGITESIPNALNYLYDYLVLPGALYFWKEQKYFYLLADESSNMSADGKTFTYKVRQGISWSDGKPITAKDVYTTALLGYVMIRPQFSYVDSFEQTDDSTVVFHIGTPAPIAQYYLLRERIVPDSLFAPFAKRAEPLVKARKPSSDKGMVALNKSISAFKPKNLVVSGPFTIDTGTLTSDQLTMTKNDKSYLAKTVKFDKIQVYQGETEAITPLMLQTKIDYATQAFPVATEEELVKKGYRIIRPPTYSGPALFFNYAKLPEFADKRARQALAYLINRQENGTVGEGKSGKGVKYMAGLSDIAVPTWISAADLGKFNTYDRDPQKAEQLLTEVGWKKQGKTWHTPQGKEASYELLFPSDYADWSAAAKNLQSQLQNFGIKIVLKGEQAVQQEVDVQGSRYTLAIQGWGSSGNPFPADSFVQALFVFNTPQLGPTQKGMDFPMVQTTDVVGKVDLQKVVVDAGKGANPADLKKNTTTAALAFNELLPIIPLWERFGNNPALTTAVTGYPPDGDPIYVNSPYADNFTAILTLQGKLKPA